MNKRIEVSITIDEHDMESLAEEYENSESSFVHDFAERVLSAAADTAREMCETANVINMANPLGKITL